MKNKLTIFTIILLFFSNWVMAQFPVHPVDTYTIVKASAGNLTVSWTAFGSLSTYDYETQIDSGGWSGITNTAATSFTIPYASLSIGNVVTWRVRDNNTGAPGLFTNYSFTVGPNPTPTPANAATGVSQATGSVSWTAFDEGGFGNGNYDVDFDGDPAFGSIDASLANTALTSLSLPALLFNTQYYWRVSDTDIDGIGGNGTWFSFSFTTILGPPTAIAASAITTTSFSANWTAHAQGGATSYRLDVGTSPGGTQVLSDVNVGAVTTYSVSGLTAGTTYYYKVRAVNAGGTSANSNEITVTTSAAPALLSPANYAVGVSVLPTFSWSNVGAPHYDLEISTDGSTWTIIADDLAATTFTVSNFNQLNSGTLYYWRVRENNGGYYSSIREFTTHLGQVTISTYFPSGTSASIAWYLLPYTANVKYDLYYSYNSFSTYSTVPNLSNTFYTLTGLLPGTTYDVLVRAKNNTGTVIITYSSTVSFTTDGLPTPYLSYPIGGPTTYSNPPYLYWYTGTYDPSVEFEVKYWKSTVSEPVSLVAQDADKGYFATGSANFYTLLTATLTPGSTYNWKVRTKSGTNYSAWSATETFVVYSTTPATAPTPYPSWPVGGATSYINPPTLYWYTGTYATGLYFNVNCTGPGGYNHTSVWFAGNLYYTLPASLVPGDYVWKVQSSTASNGSNPSGWSSNAEFTIPSSSSSVSVPYPTSPVGTIISTLNPTLTWYALTPPALKYRVRISPYSSTDGNGMLDHPTAVSSTLITSTSSAFNSLSFTPSVTLVAGATYYWQVQAELFASPFTASNWSYVVSFQTAAGASSVVPLVISPNYLQPINNTSAILTWKIPVPMDSHLKYDLQYAKNENFSNAVTKTNINEPVMQVTGLETNSTYYWRVLSKTNSGSVSSYSSTGSFKTSGATAVEDNQEIPTAFELSQNYPNPFNPTTKITYALPQNAFVSIKVYDMLGREVRSLVNNEMLAGNHSIEWSGVDNAGNKVASGAYIYRITAGNFISTKKMVMIK